MRFEAHVRIDLLLLAADVISRFVVPWAVTCEDAPLLGQLAGRFDKSAILFVGADGCVAAAVQIPLRVQSLDAELSLVTNFMQIVQVGAA